ncbi:MAG: phage holin family protein [Candidatus Saccharimonadales bacterium]
MNRLPVRFTIRWFVSSLGLWLVAVLFDKSITFTNHVRSVIIGGLVVAVINIIVRPILVVLSWPLLLLSVGFFMIVINGLVVFLAGKLYAPLHISSFATAILAGIMIGLLNYLLTTVLDSRLNQSLT